ncbi:hypothetical protein [Actinomadura roseirufa]|uniref:hypothetical protein n=1 Tax=Actinomadura roseirufa TaxID=2094049 RepID=UPI0010416FB1|nr:hypothetical protein [Actinomadura roseirufa]
MRQAFAHDAVLLMEPDSDVRAPGAAITVGLCGHWNHPPPCPLAPHWVEANRDGDEARVRVLFAAEPDAEQEVRDRIDRALSGRIQFPAGFAVQWRLIESRPSAVAPSESDTATHLIQH